MSQYANYMRVLKFGVDNAHLWRIMYNTGP